MNIPVKEISSDEVRINVRINPVGRLPQGYWPEPDEDWANDIERDLRQNDDRW